ncbi:PAN/APPLE-like domain containing protein [Chrysochromulina ericina virus CeV-01B]|uniref:PAN/APPLE-like domain containing protein n=1 Tax=Chrysochromulina ericina virus CeV-01B TaxID=3070830 RepID=A0A0N9R3K7_9VIRU|nr:PAN/APPLE-like domain containing protein [Chrysochromulina ericina virus]ALH23100.1 PAN/APPLE-like domain containing protein [Chrysochromulina ericina virus CeV-01B]
MVRKTKISKTFCKMLIIVCIVAILYSLARSFLFSREGLDNHGLTDFVYHSSNATLPWTLLGKNTDYPGNDIVNIQNISLDQCKDRCVSTTGCNGIVLDNNSKTCYLKKKMSDTYKRSKDGDDSYQYNGISRTSSSCNNSEDCLKKCEYSIIKENKNCFTGTDNPLNLITMLSNYSNITTPSACGDKCRPNDKCEGYVWRDPSKYGQENNCQLRGGFYGHNPVDLINSCKDSGNAGWNTYLCKQPGGTIDEWHGCNMSSICVSPYSFCRIGDNRCLTDTECAWANSQNGTSRDCTPMPLSTNFSGTYTINDTTFLITQSKDSSGRLSSNAIIEPLNQDPNIISQFGKISYATIDNNIMTWSWTGSGTGGPWGRGPFFSKLITVGNQTGLTFKRTGNYENKINWLRISK